MHRKLGRSWTLFKMLSAFDREFRAEIEKLCGSEAIEVLAN